MLTATAAVFSQQENKGHFVPETYVEKKKKKEIVNLCYAKTLMHKNIEALLFNLILNPVRALCSPSLFICRL